MGTLTGEVVVYLYTLFQNQEHYLDLYFHTRRILIISSIKIMSMHIFKKTISVQTACCPSCFDYSNNYFFCLLYTLTWLHSVLCKNIYHRAIFFAPNCFVIL